MTKQLSWREYERQNDDIKKAEILKVPVTRIFVKEGFNPRDINKPETAAKIQSIKDAYIAGKYVKPLEVSLDGDEVVIVDGHCRFAAVMLANQELKTSGMPEIESLVVVPFKGNDIDRLVHTVTGNEGEKLTPLEVSEVVKRLNGQGFEVSRIAKELNYSASWVDRLIALANCPEAVKVMIRNGKCSVDVALAAVKQHGEGAAAMIGEIAETTEGKVTAKHVKKEKTAKPLTMEKMVFGLAKELAFLLPEELPELKTNKSSGFVNLQLDQAVVDILVQIQKLLTDEPA